MLGVVFDTVVLVHSFLNPHSIWGRLIFAHGDRYVLYTSPAVLREVLEVIERPSLKQKYRTTRDGGIERLLEIVSQANVVEIGDIPATSRDPKDDKFLATAEAALADYVVSEDRDLLDLGEYQRVKIIDAAAFLKILESQEERAIES